MDNLEKIVKEEKVVKDKKEFNDFLNKIYESVLKNGLNELKEMYADIESRCNLSTKNQFY
jgi:hypothetical protein